MDCDFKHFLDTTGFQGDIYPGLDERKALKNIFCPYAAPSETS